jgi:hypothetical protein
MRAIAVNDDELARRSTLPELHEVSLLLAGWHVEGSADVPTREVFGPAGVDDHGGLIPHMLPDLVKRDAIPRI